MRVRERCGGRVRDRGECGSDNGGESGCCSSDGRKATLAYL